MQVTDVCACFILKECLVIAFFTFATDLNAYWVCRWTNGVHSTPACTSLREGLVSYQCTLCTPGSIVLAETFSPSFQICGRVGLDTQLPLSGDPFFQGSKMFLMVPAFMSPCLLASSWVCVEKENVEKLLFPVFNVFHYWCVPCAQVQGSYPPAGFCCWAQQVGLVSNSLAPLSVSIIRATDSLCLDPGATW